MALDVVLKVYFEPLAKRRRIASKLHAMITFDRSKKDFPDFDGAELRSFYQDETSLIQVSDLHSDLNDFAYALLGGLHVDHEGSGCLYDIPLWSHGWDSYYQHGYHALVDLTLPTTGQIAVRSAHMAHRSRS